MNHTPLLEHLSLALKNNFSTKADSYYMIHLNPYILNIWKLYFSPKSSKDSKIINS